MAPDGIARQTGPEPAICPPSIAPHPVSVSYLVHDLADPAVGRRVTMLRQGGAVIDLSGFRRSPTAPNMVAGVAARDLGKTADGRFLARILSVLRSRVRLGHWGRAVGQADSILARNLEMLYLAAAARRRFGPGKPLFYELLDIHRLMIGDGAVSAWLRRLEYHLLRQCDGIMISSPAFEREYLRRYYRDLPPIRLWENKVMPGAATGLAQDDPASLPPIPGRPWRIGWFGAIRCRRSLLCLADLARKYPGLIEVDIRGRVTAAMGADFQAIVDAAPGLCYHGPYRYPDDLAAIYRPVHFVWAVDFYEAGFNSSWLLPNRLYEGGYCRRVPIALASVETGRWLAAQRLGFCLGDALEPEVERLLTEMSPAAYATAAAASQAADPDLFRLSDRACQDMAADLRQSFSPQNL